MKHPHRPKIDSSATHHHGKHRPEEKKRLLWCILITGIMMVIEAIGGYLTNSLALMSDAGHMFSHLFALSVSYFAILLASRPVNDQKTYGYFRLEILAALLNGLTLVIIAGLITYEAIQRFAQPEPIAEIEMLLVAIAGLVVNLATALILFKASHQDINIRGAFLHMVGDTLSSVGVVIAAIIIHFTNFLLLDPLVSVIIAIVIVIWAIKLILDSVHILLESTPKHIRLEKIEAKLKENIPEIKDIHDLHVWEITSNMYAMTAHILVEDCMLNRACFFIEQVNSLLDEHFDIEHTTIQIECAPVTRWDKPISS